MGTIVGSNCLRKVISEIRNYVDGVIFEDEWIYMFYDYFKFSYSKGDICKHNNFENAVVYGDENIKLILQIRGEKIQITKNDFLLLTNIQKISIIKFVVIMIIMNRCLMKPYKK